MNRRTFLRATVGLGATGMLAGCSDSGNNGPPPRKSEVVKQVAVVDDALTVQLEDSALVQSRADVTADQQTSDGNTTNSQSVAVSDTADAVVGAVGSLSPIGVAAGKGRGTGKGGRGAAAGTATGRNGRAKWAGGTYAVWYDDHEDEVEEYDAKVVGVGIAFLAALSSGESSLPGPGPVPWDQTWTAENGDFEGESITYDFQRTGWYRVGTHLVAENGDHDFGWEAVDFRVTENDNGEYVVKNQWKVSPRL